MLECLFNGDVHILNTVFGDDADSDTVGVLAGDDGVPAVVRFSGRKLKKRQENVCHSLLFQFHGNKVGIRSGCGTDDSGDIHITEGGDLALGGKRDRQGASADDQISFETEFTQCFHGVLRRFRLEVTHRVCRKKGYVNKNKIAVAVLPVHLTDRLKERHTFNITDRSSYLDNTDLRVVAVLVGPAFCGMFDSVFDLVGDVRNNLNGRSKIIAVALFLNNRGVDLSGGQIVIPGKLDVKEPLIVSQIKVSLTAVL